MAFILPGIFSLIQHLGALRKAPESYRPERCPGCRHVGIWCHGCYTRKPDRKDLGEPCLNPVPILRFFCPECRSTCSVLPECIPPRSWYLWEVRQVIFLLLLAGESIGHTLASNGSRASRKTIKRWWQRFNYDFQIFSFHLRLHFPCLGRYDGFTKFWTACLAMSPLSSAMRLLHEEGIVVP